MHSVAADHKQTHKLLANINVDCERKAPRNADASPTQGGETSQRTSHDKLAIAASTHSLCRALTIACTILLNRKKWQTALFAARAGVSV